MDNWFKEFCRDYLAWTTADRSLDWFLDSRWGKWCLRFVTVSFISGIGSIYSYLKGLSASWRYGFLGFSLAALLFAVVLAIEARRSRPQSLAIEIKTSEPLNRATAPISTTDQPVKTKEISESRQWPELSTDQIFDIQHVIRRSLDFEHVIRRGERRETSIQIGATYGGMALAHALASIFQKNGFALVLDDYDKSYIFKLRDAAPGVTIESWRSDNPEQERVRAMIVLALMAGAGLKVKVTEFRDEKSPDEAEELFDEAVQSNFVRIIIGDPE